jgi:glycosyltransferase involved in cell wall biosynthesis
LGNAREVKVSIVIPTFNRATMLRELMDSVAAQAHRPIEVVVVDDGSTDGTEDVVKEFFSACRHDDSLGHCYERLEDRSGAPVARNRGVALAQGDAVMFVDSDDLLATSGISALARCLSASADLAYAYGKVAITRDSLAESDWAGIVGGAFGATPAEIAGYHWHTMGALYRREFLERVGEWNEQLTGSQDWEFQARVKLAGGAGEFVDTLVGYWRQHDQWRVGATHFRPDYVTSVMVACQSIVSHAKDAGRCDRSLRNRIAKRLLIHALEWGANNHGLERRDCLALAAQSAPIVGMWGVAARLMNGMPLAIDKAVMRRYHARRAMAKGTK